MPSTVAAIKDLTMSPSPTTLLRKPLPTFAGSGVWNLLEMRAKVTGDRPAMVWQPFDREPQTWTYSDLFRDASSAAAGMARRGIRPGDRVMIHLENCPEFVISWLACTALGAVAVSTNTRSADDELSYFKDDAGVSAVITQPKFVERLGRIAHDAMWMVSTDHDAGVEPSSGSGAGREETFSNLLQDPSELQPWTVDLSAPMCVQYTSGTTSRPKGVVWSQANGMWAARTNAIHESLTPADSYLCYLPMYHTNALAYTMLACLWAGARFVVVPKWSTSRFWDISLRHGCTWASVVGLTARAIEGLEAPPDHRYRLFGGACDLSSMQRIGVKGLGWWGMTETVSQPIIGDPFTPNREWSMGRPSPEYGVIVVDDDDRPVAPDETGNLLIRGERGVSIFAEYLNNPRATAESFTADGWFRTGDRVTWHADGHLSFSDRSKDMLRVGGENVAASEIERVLLGVTGVVEAAVVGGPDAALDEVPVAFVLAHGDPSEVRRAALAECARSLASFKQPRAIYVVDELPRSTLEKVNKVRLRELAAAETTA